MSYGHTISLRGDAPPAELPPLVIVDDETGERRTIVGYCLRCRCSRDDFPDVILSPKGTAHVQGEDGFENMVCGADGARDGWLWPL